MPWWLLPAEFLGKLALKYGVKRLEKKYPGIAPVLDKIMAWLDAVPVTQRAEAVETLDKHCDGLFCASDLKRM